MKQRGEAALIPFITAGDPDLATTLKIMRALEAGGADAIELGIPFSDPTADGPTIQRSSERALKKPISLPAIFQLGTRFPPHFRSADNSLWLLQSVFPLRAGKVRSHKRHKPAPTAYFASICRRKRAANLKAGPTAAISTDFLACRRPAVPDRLRLVAHHGRGFIYYVSVTGVTGARQSFEAILAPPSRPGT